MFQVGIYTLCQILSKIIFLVGSEFLNERSSSFNQLAAMTELVLAAALKLVPHATICADTEYRCGAQWSAAKNCAEVGVSLHINQLLFSHLFWVVGHPAGIFVLR
ncbi:hypothetical protein KO116_03057 [Halomonas sp. KO116]|nr:hypothetical protein KO116_03057 [Halomonas sp. KO116]